MTADANNYDLQNVECQSLVPSCKICRQGSQREQLPTLVTFLGVACVSSSQRRQVVWLTVASQCFQHCVTMLAMVATFSTSFSFSISVTIDRNPAFTVHATAHAVRAAINLNSMFLRQQIWCSANYFIFGWQTSCWNGYDVVLKVVMVIFILGMLK